MGDTLSLGAAAGLLSNDAAGVPAATLTGFGGGDLGGAVTDNLPGASVTLAGGALTVNTDGSFDLNGPTTVGTFSFEYRLENGAGSDDATVTVEVREPPTANDDPLFVTINDTLSGDLAANDVLGSPAATLTGFGGGDLGGSVTDNAPGSSVSLAGGTLTVDADGSLALVNPNTPGSYSFDYRLENPVGADDATVTVTVVDLVADLSITMVDDADPVVAGNALSYTLTISNAGPDEAVNVVVTDTLPAGVTLVATTGCAEDPTGVPTCTLGTIAAGVRLSSRSTSPSIPGRSGSSPTVAA